MEGRHLKTYPPRQRGPWDGDGEDARIEGRGHLEETAVFARARRFSPRVDRGVILRALAMPCEGS
jgi:hypothetical protein